MTFTCLSSETSGKVYQKINRKVINSSFPIYFSRSRLLLPRGARWTQAAPPFPMLQPKFTISSYSSVRESWKLNDNLKFLPNISEISPCGRANLRRRWLDWRPLRRRRNIGLLRNHGACDTVYGTSWRFRLTNSLAQLSRLPSPPSIFNTAANYNIKNASAGPTTIDFLLKLHITFYNNFEVKQGLTMPSPPPSTN